MNSIYDVRQLLQKYGAFIYTGDRLGDLELFEMEIRQLYDWQMVDAITYKNGLLIIRKEMQDYKKGLNDKT